MLEESFEKLYLKFRAHYCRDLFRQMGAREGSLTATEAYCLEVVYLLGHPTLREFSDYVGISAPNATYRINTLAAKGYVERVASEKDRRTVRLRVTDKFRNYYGLYDAYNANLMKNIREQFSAEEVRSLESMIERIVHDMM